MDVVKEFQGEYRFPSNFWRADTYFADEYDARMYPTSEAAYQAAKSILPKERKMIAEMKPGEAKRVGKKITLRPDWENIKLDVMYKVVKDKFSRNPHLQAKLLATGDMELREGNTWGDKFWGVVGNTGHNHLGKILMQVREELR